MHVKPLQAPVEQSASIEHSRLLGGGSDASASEVNKQIGSAMRSEVRSRDMEDLMMSLRVAINP